MSYNKVTQCFYLKGDLIVAQWLCECVSALHVFLNVQLVAASWEDNSYKAAEAEMSIIF